MHCDHQLIIEHINDFVENKTSPELCSEIEQVLDNCEVCQQTHRQCLELYQMSFDWQTENVPDWHRTSYAVRPPIKTATWLNWGSLATSSLAILLVVFQLEVSTGDSGLMISFGGNQSDARIEKLVAAQLADYKKQQENLLSVKLSNEFEKQDNLAKLRFAGWTEKNRQERQQEIKFVMTGWQSQRYEDQKMLDQQLSYLADNQIENNQIINKIVSNVNPK